MAVADDILRGVDRARRIVERAVEEARAQSRAKSGSVNVVRRKNVVVAAYSGAPDSAEVASACQTVVIEQSDAREVSQAEGTDAGASPRNIS